jgi:hypothetical protein
MSSHRLHLPCSLIVQSMEALHRTICPTELHMHSFLQQELTIL